jgi:murein DD-endopeptidase MepM/ murein hydrolase activator NlpD
MKYKSLSQPLVAGIYEPEGIYLSTPFDGVRAILQLWGQHADHYGQYRYNGIPLKGHIGVDFDLEVGSSLYAVDDGRVMEISYEAGGFERYLKLEHRWGESFYAYVGEIAVEAGQLVKRNEFIARSGRPAGSTHPPQLHFGIRITPFNRFDGWGGFSNPLPFLNPSNLILPDSVSDLEGGDVSTLQPHPMAVERPGMRRP